MIAFRIFKQLYYKEDFLIESGPSFYTCKEAVLGDMQANLYEFFSKKHSGDCIFSSREVYEGECIPFIKDYHLKIKLSVVVRKLKDFLEKFISDYNLEASLIYDPYDKSMNCEFTTFDGSIFIEGIHAYYVYDIAIYIFRVLYYVNRNYPLNDVFDVLLESSSLLRNSIFLSNKFDGDIKLYKESLLGLMNSGDDKYNDIRYYPNSLYFSHYSGIIDSFKTRR